MSKRHHGDSLGPPRRWLNCPRRGNKVIGGLFIPFKTPLDSRYDDQVPQVNRFTPSMLIDAFRRDRIDVGLWIDLTKTTRYYDRRGVENSGIQYEKFALDGHSEPPTEVQVDAFIRLCKRFFDQNPGKVVAVHCTHGFNRTGYLICSYLVAELFFDPRAAIDEFSKCRPPGIYKQQYLDRFFSKYSPNSEGLPKAPELPDWCFEENEDDEDGPPARRSRNEITTENPTFMEGVPGVTPITDLNEISRIRNKVRSMIGWKASGFPGAQPVSLSSSNINFLKEFKYMVSWKADGTRYMMLIESQDRVFFIDRNNSIFKLHHVAFPSPDLKGHLIDTLLDGEMVLDNPGTGQALVPRYFIYDIVTFNGRNIGQENFSRRLDCIRNYIYNPRENAKRKGLIRREKEPIGIRPKKFWDLSQIETVMNLDNATGHSHDGLILQPVNDAYTGGRCPKILKWKPPELNSADFKLRLVKVQKPGCLPENRANLYVIESFDRPMILFSSILIPNDKATRKEFENYDEKIVECVYNSNAGQWKVIRIRTDKHHPNSIRTVNGVMQSINDGYDKEYMLRFILGRGHQNSSRSSH